MTEMTLIPPVCYRLCWDILQEHGMELTPVEVAARLPDDWQDGAWYDYGLLKFSVRLSIVISGTRAELREAKELKQSGVNHE